MSAIEGYENYLIFEDGVIINTDTGKEMKPSIDKDGYKLNGLTKNNKTKTFKLHRLIALAFIPNIDNKPCVDHINRDRKDNRLENLRWVSYKENSRNQSCRSNTGLQFITKANKKESKNGYYYQFTLTRQDLKHSYSNKDLQPVIEYRNKFCEENDIEFNDK